MKDWSVIKAFFVLTFATLAVGCSGLREAIPGDEYVDVSVAYQIDEWSDWYLRTGREWQCSDNFKAIFEAGTQLNDKWSVAYTHQSWWSCGKPFNNHPELYTDDIRVTRRFSWR